MRRAAAGEPGPLWILADTQTAGRGRSGRSWASEPGNLHASLLVRLALPSPRAYQLSLVAGVAVLEAVRRAVSPVPSALRLKWPNDLLVASEKTGGILVESSSSAGQSLAAVIGIGINLVSHPAGVDRPVTHLGAHATQIPAPAALLDVLASYMQHWLAVWQNGQGFPEVREAWLSGAHPIGERLRIVAGAKTVEGTFAGLDPEGALILADPSGRKESFTFGDVTTAT